MIRNSASTNHKTTYTYLRAHYHDHAVGRFISTDTVQPNAAGTQGYNLYAYTGTLLMRTIAALASARRPTGMIPERFKTSRHTARLLSLVVESALLAMSSVLIMAYLFWWADPERLSWTWGITRVALIILVHILLVLLWRATRSARGHRRNKMN